MRIPLLVHFYVTKGVYSQSFITNHKILRFRMWIVSQSGLFCEWYNGRVQSSVIYRRMFYFHSEAKSIYGIRLFGISNTYPVLTGALRDNNFYSFFYKTHDSWLWHYEFHFIHYCVRNYAKFFMIYASLALLLWNCNIIQFLTSTISTVICL